MSTQSQSQRPGLAALAAITASIGLAATAQAQTTPLSIYGTIDLAVGQLASQPPGPPNAPIVKNRGVHSGGQQTSYWGVRGTEDLGDGLKAKFQLESFIRLDTGQPGRFNTPTASDPFWSRSAWVGLEGSLGEVRLGLNGNPAWLSMVFSNAMSSNSLFSPSFRQQYNGSTRGYMGLDTGLPNSVSYTTPRFGGATATLVVQAGEGSGDGANYIGNIVYRGGPLMLTGAFANTSHEPPPEAPALQDQALFVLGGSYDFTVVKAFVQYTHFEDKLSGLKIKTPHLGLTAPLGAGELQLAWARATNSGANSDTRTTTSLGYVYLLSRRSNLYAMFASDKLPVGTASSYIVGMRHTF